MKRARRLFTPEFKLEAVRLLVSRQRSLTQVAREIAVRPRQTLKWQTPASIFSELLQ